MPILFPEVDTFLCAGTFGSILIAVSVILIRFSRLSKDTSIFVAMIATAVLWIDSVVVTLFLSLLKHGYLSGLAVFLTVLVVLSIILIIFWDVSEGSTLRVLPIISLASAILIVLYTSFAGRIQIRVQAMAAQPYIQVALDETCGANQFVADVHNFYFEYKPYDNSGILFNGPFLRWVSSDGAAQCIFTVPIIDGAYSEHEQIWQCTCP